MSHVFNDIIIKSMGDLNIEGTGGVVFMSDTAADSLTIVAATQTIASTANIIDLNGTDDFLFAATSQTLSNKTHDTLRILDQSGTGPQYLELLVTEDLMTTNKTLTLTVNDESRIIDLGGNITISGALTTAGTFTTAGGDLLINGIDAGGATLSVPASQPTGGVLVLETATQNVSSKTLSATTYTGNMHSYSTSFVGTYDSGAAIVLNGTATMTVAGQTGVTSGVTLTNDPVLSTDSANKRYVDSVAVGLDPKESVRVTTYTDVGGVYMDESPASTPDTIANVDLTDTLIFDLAGVTLAAGDRILLKNQTNATENGIYVVQTVSGSPAGTDSILERATDQDGVPGAEVSGGNFTFVENGTVHENSGWVLQGDGVLTVNVDDLVWVQFSAATSILAGEGLVKVGNQLDVDVSLSNTVFVDADNSVKVLSSETVGQVLLSVGDNSPATNEEATWGALDLALTGTSVTNELTVTNGGTGLNSVAADNLLLGSGSTALSTLAPSANSVLVTGPSPTTAVSWSTTLPDVTIDCILDSQVTPENMLCFVTAATGASNYFQIENADTNTGPTLSVQGAGADLDMYFMAKGMGVFNFLSEPTNSPQMGAEIRLDDGVGDSYAGLAAPQDVTTSYTLVLPTAAGSVGQTLEIASVNGSDVELAFTPNASANTQGYSIVATQLQARDMLDTVGYFAYDESKYSGVTGSVHVWYEITDSATATTLEVTATAVDATAGTVALGTTGTIMGGTASPGVGITRAVATFTLSLGSLTAATDYRFDFKMLRGGGGGSPEIAELYGIQMEFTFP